MNAIEFIQQHGVEKAREVVEGIPSKYMSCYYSNLCYCTKSKKYSDRFKPRESLVNMGWLKRLVESVELVESCGGLAEAKWHLDSLECSCKYGGLESVRENYKRLKQAIADYESIYGGEHV